MLRLRTQSFATSKKLKPDQLLMPLIAASHSDANKKEKTLKTLFQNKVTSHSFEWNLKLNCASLFSLNSLYVWSWIWFKTSFTDGPYVVCLFLTVANVDSIMEKTHSYNNDKNSPRTIFTPFFYKHSCWMNDIALNYICNNLIFLSVL